MDFVTNTELLNQIGISGNQTKKPKNVLGQEDFLELMVAQMKNQDPFQPLENGDFIAQIAQFGSVSGINELKNSFGTLSAAMVSNQGLQAASLIDRTARVATDKVKLTGDESLVKGAIDLPPGSISSIVSIYNKVGDLVKRIPLAESKQGVAEFSWDGTDSNGQKLRPGSYRITAEAFDGNKNSAVPVLVDNRIVSISFDSTKGQGAVLRLENDTEVGFNQIRQIM